jgi:hypothetical protein
MRLSTLFPFVALITSVLAISLPISEECASEPGAEICGSQILPSPTVNVDVVERAPSTNAERFARGLPPAPPRRRHNHHSPSRTHTCSPSPLPPVTYRGVIQVFDGLNSLGFLADNTYYTPFLTPDLASAYVVSFTLPNGATTGSTLDLTAQVKTFTLLGVSQGRDNTSPDFAPGSFNYGYIGGTTHTAPNATPQSVSSFFADSTGLAKPSESAVWSVDLTTGALTVQWVNTDGSKPTTFTFVQANFAYVGGDPDAFHSRFPAPMIPVTFKFIPII